jgi:hypothetical protein
VGSLSPTSTRLVVLPLPLIEPNEGRLRELAHCQSALGTLFAAIPTSNHWRQARNWYVQSLDTLAKLTQPSPTDTKEKQRIKAEIANTDAAIAKG